MAKKRDNDPRYFYAVVLLTLAIAGVMIWEIFFSGAVYERSTDPSLERAPEVDMFFLDSRYFNSLTEFERGDDPLLPWKEASKNNPFSSPVVPEERTVRDWWGIFNLGFATEDSELMATKPTIVEGENLPDLILFEERTYQLDLKEVEGTFEIVDNAGTSVSSYEHQEDEDIVFTASSAMDGYRVGDLSGSVRVVDREGSETEEEELDRGEILLSGRSILSSYYNTIRRAVSELDEEDIDQADSIHSDLESQLRSIEDAAREGQFEDEDLQMTIDDFKSEVEEEINILNQKVEETE